VTSSDTDPVTETADGSLEQVISSATLLFVDDESNILSSLRRLFRPLGYKILLAPGGEEGLEIMRNSAVDLVISDMRMPEMDGATFLARVAEQWPTTMRILLTGYADMESTIAAINAGKIYKYISKPWDENEIKISVRRALEQRFLEQERQRLLALTKRQNRELQAFNANLEETVRQRTQELRKTMELLEQAHRSLKDNYVGSIKVLSNIIELRESGSTGHARRVAELARDLAVKMDLDSETVQQVLFAALLHNIGKVGLPDRLINKPFHELLAEERDQVMKHPAIGEGLLMGLDNLQLAAKLIRNQHEQFNGCGYPDGLAREAIPLGARIIALANDYDELLHGMLLRKQQSQSEAQSYLLKHRGKRYDPELVDIFLDMVGAAKARPTKERVHLVKSNGLTAGMMLARDLVVHDRALLLSKGHLLDEGLIQRIHELERSLDEDLDIYVIVPGG